MPLTPSCPPAGNGPGQREGSAQRSDSEGQGRGQSGAGPGETKTAGTDHKISERTRGAPAEGVQCSREHLWQKIP